MFSIILDEIYLTEKSKKQGTTKTYEQKNNKLYEDFKKIVTDSFAHYVENVDQIGKQVVSEINNIVNHSKYNMIGLAKLNTEINIWFSRRRQMDILQPSEYLKSIV